MGSRVQQIVRHQQALRDCRRCPDMQPPVVIGQPLVSTVLLIGQAPGAREGELGRPFAWTAGKTLFGWFSRLGLDEQGFRESVYMAAVCRCFPGKQARGGDRVPRQDEIINCAGWLGAEMQILRPRLVLPVGKLAISRILPVAALRDVVGRKFRVTIDAVDTDVIPLPHPSGASTWHRTEPGRSLLDEALHLIAGHAAWQRLVAGCKAGRHGIMPAQ